MGERGKGVGDYLFSPFPYFFRFLLRPPIFPLLFNQVITRADLQSKKIMTIMVFTLVGCALCFMGLEIDLAVVLACIKVNFSDI